MRQGLALVALLLPLSGCVVPPPQPVGYGYGYPQPGYPFGEPAYPGYSYNAGSPSLYVEGATVPLIFYGGGWGYWDGYHRWHRAPEGIGRDLEHRHPGGFGYRPWGGGQFARPEGGRPDGWRSDGGRPGGFRQEGFRQGGPPPGGGFRPGANPSAGHPGAPPPARPWVQGQPWVQPGAVPARAAAAPERHRHDDHN